MALMRQETRATILGSNALAPLRHRVTVDENRLDSILE
jgi:hypothetical protein